MAKEFTRTDRVADAMQRELSQALQFEVRDPRIGMVNVNAVEVTRDLAYAKVFVTFVEHGSEEEAKEAMKALERATGFLRSYLAKNMDLRFTPQLRFVYDKSVSRGQQLSALISKAVHEDAAKNPKDEDGEA